ncbi:MAG: right-handed parallel beta-helix repeat-containing protein [Armatimonadota bacterium]
MRNTFWALTMFCMLAISTAAWANPAQVWVSAGWTGPDNCGGHAWQTDAFATIQAGINAVEPGGTVTVSAGVYPEWLVITKSLSLHGPQTGVDPNGSNARIDPGSEARIIPPYHQTELPAGMLVAVKASNVTIDGFTIDGDNAALSGGDALNGADVNAASGIGNRDVHVEGLLVAHNIIQNLRCEAVSLVNPGWPVQSSGSSAILYNRITNLPKSSWPEHPQYMPPVWGTGVLVQRENVRVAYNTITEVATGVDIHTLFSHEGTAAPVITNNTIVASQTGIGINLLSDPLRIAGPQAQISGNAITITAHRQTEDAFPTTGLFILYIEHQSQILASGNTISGGDAGVLVWEAPTYNVTNTTLANCTITGSKYGLWFMNYYPHGDFGPARSSGVLLSGVTIIAPQIAGIYLQDEAGGDGPVTLTVTGVTVQGGPVGLLLRGPRTVVNGGLNLIEQTVQPIVTEAGAQAPG